MLEYGADQNQLMPSNTPTLVNGIHQLIITNNYSGKPVLVYALENCTDRIILHLLNHGAHAAASYDWSQHYNKRTEKDIIYYWLKAYECEYKSEFQLACDCYQEIIKKDPENARAQQLLIKALIANANINFNQSNYAQAINNFNQADNLSSSSKIEILDEHYPFSLTPKIGILCANAMKCYEETGNYENALELLIQAEKIATVAIKKNFIEPYFTTIYKWWGVQLFNQGHYQAAREKFNILLKRNLIDAEEEAPLATLNILKLNKDNEDYYTIKLNVADEKDGYFAIYDEKSKQKLADLFYFVKI